MNATVLLVITSEEFRQYELIIMLFRDKSAQQNQNTIRHKTEHNKKSPVRASF